ncbi:hypothetical protein [Amycolatopsis echigonensis]|uniref:Uncharacterized protein n=1 Tax=Amycolatopsis echigonensis TaxID=2576905 RepID=A0A8E1W2U3_9PSEU|nr:hypothetical protein [Amycolatopsis echigonensis]MBB2502927.1 hypothetical protein [Amycolatopsis echigonensis]
MSRNRSTRTRDPGKPMGVIEVARLLACIDGRAGRLYEADIRQARYIVGASIHRNGATP